MGFHLLFTWFDNNVMCLVINSLFCSCYLSCHAKLFFSGTAPYPSATFLTFVSPVTALVQECWTFLHNGDWVCRCRKNFQSKCFQRASRDHYTDSYQRKHWNLRKPTGFGKSFIFQAFMPFIFDMKYVVPPSGTQRTRSSCSKCQWHQRQFINTGGKIHNVLQIIFASLWFCFNFCVFNLKFFTMDTISHLFAVTPELISSCQMRFTSFSFISLAAWCGTLNSARSTALLLETSSLIINWPKMMLSKNELSCSFS